MKLLKNLFFLLLVLAAFGLVGYVLYQLGVFTVMTPNEAPGR